MTMTYKKVNVNFHSAICNHIFLHAIKHEHFPPQPHLFIATTIETCSFFIYAISYFSFTAAPTPPSKSGSIFYLNSDIFADVLL